MEIDSGNKIHVVSVEIFNTDLFKHCFCSGSELNQRGLTIYFTDTK